MNDAKDLKNWLKIDRNNYRYFITPRIYYDLYIEYKNKNPHLSIASAYIQYEWSDYEGNNFVDRECLIENRPLITCLEVIECDVIRNSV